MFPCAIFVGCSFSLCCSTALLSGVPGISDLDPVVNINTGVTAVKNIVDAAYADQVIGTYNDALGFSFKGGGNSNVHFTTTQMEKCEG